MIKPENKYDQLNRCLIQNTFFWLYFEIKFIPFSTNKDKILCHFYVNLLPKGSNYIE
ncbi:hypothetical protein FHW89_003826 [Mucilaginibacter sp. SG564]|nr:hypothetical protein [Mucilaginibacter sp. SG564]